MSEPDCRHLDTLSSPNHGQMAHACLLQDGLSDIKQEACVIDPCEDICRPRQRSMSNNSSANADATAQGNEVNGEQSNSGESNLGTPFSTPVKVDGNSGYSPSSILSGASRGHEEVEEASFLGSLNLNNDTQNNTLLSLAQTHGLEIRTTPPELSSKQFDLELVGANRDRPRGDSNRLAPEARDAIRGRVPSFRKPSFRTEPSETDITDNGNRLHSLISQDRPLDPLSSIVPEDSLEDKLLDCLQQTTECQEIKGFFPRDLLDGLIDETCVSENLTTVFQDVFDNDTILAYTRKICGLPPNKDGGNKSLPIFKRIFVILVLSERLQSIVKFLTHGLSDEYLPLSKIPRVGRSSAMFYLGKRSAPSVPLECFRGWSSGAIGRFEEWQWPTISPFFAKSYKRKFVTHFLLQDQAILPFTSDSSRGSHLSAFESAGGFSTVSRVEIHPQHHDFHGSDSTNNCFAVKCLVSSDRGDFDREVEMLKKFSGDDCHLHLVSLLATYEQHNKFYLVFHWAEADLLNYWRNQNPTPRPDHNTISWMAEQCHGIADGLLRIHRHESSNSKDNKSTLQIPSSSMSPIFGRHGDIKPANVLLFCSFRNNHDLGTLKLADFGLSEFNSLHSRSGKPNGDIGNSPTYRPPECDLQHGTIDRSYDIWTLGCLYIEFITWLLGGWELVQRFSDARTSHDPIRPHWPTDNFFEIVKCKDTDTPGAMVKPAVTEFILCLHTHEACTDYIHNFLDLIEFNMLIVNPNDENERGRSTCEEVLLKLRNMHIKVKGKGDYATQPTPWCPNPKEHMLATAVEAEVPQRLVDELLGKDLRVHCGNTQRRMSKT